MLYRVTKQYGRGGDTPVSQFTNVNDAKKMIQEKLIEDARYKLKVTYRLWEGMDLLEEFTEADIAETSSGGGSDESSSSPGRRSSFQPTPFNPAPRLGPQSWIKDDDQEDDEKK